MPVDNLAPSTIDKPTWAVRVSSLLAKRRPVEAFRLLDKIIEEDLGLFRDLPEIQEERRLAWLYRIDLLRERGRIAEALAWTCLECELNPSNVTAQALKERLKRFLYLGQSPTPHSSGGVRRGRGSEAWEGVAGMRELKAILERDVILPHQEPELYKLYKVGIPNGVLLYGPPGCGKTFIARALSKRLDRNYIEVKPSDLASTYIHGTQQKIGQLFEQAQSTAPAVVFFDELDALVPDRSAPGVYHHSASEVNEFLVQLDGCSDRGILVIGATNRRRGIDAAVKRPGRLDKHVYVGPPDVEARVEAVRLYMNDRPQEPMDWYAIAEQTEGYSFAELAFIVDEAARAALTDRRDISESDLQDALLANPPQVKPARHEYE